MDFKKVLAVLRALDDEKVAYVLVGGIGMMVHGIVRATQDVDLFVRDQEENVARLRAALRRVFPEDTSIEQISAADLAGDYPVIRYNSPDGSLSVDLIARLGDAFSLASVESETRMYEGVVVRVATPKMLYEKKDTVRLQDQADAQILKEEFDLSD